MKTRIKKGEKNLFGIVIIITLLLTIIASSGCIINQSEKIKEFCYEKGWSYNPEYTTTPYACFDIKSDNNGSFIITQRYVKVFPSGIFWVDVYGTNNVSDKLHKRTEVEL